MDEKVESIVQWHKGKQVKRERRGERDGLEEMHLAFSRVAHFALSKGQDKVASGVKRP